METFTFAPGSHQFFSVFIRIVKSISTPWQDWSMLLLSLFSNFLANKNLDREDLLPISSPGRSQRENQKIEADVCGGDGVGLWCTNWSEERVPHTEW